ncbi:MAG: cob(I)yrinic acid a,c-diamide adenosyltransferase, partial [Proteobacteria bacterium]|nr:cob(I)yrinic acid a,c-diamide adenosyltransferase [Pseudomonadota bacterium]
MVKLTKIYTKGGDKGKTSLGNGKRVLKSDARIEAIGAIDEANAAIGLSRLFVPKDLDALLCCIQNDLFDVGADLCKPNLDKEALRISACQVLHLEKQIDILNEALSPLTSFILPAGTASALHLARAIVRRAERRVVALHILQDLNPELIKYLNRLSDLLFVMTRLVNDKQETLWAPGKNIDK